MAKNMVVTQCKNGIMSKYNKCPLLVFYSVLTIYCFRGWFENGIYDDGVLVEGSKKSSGQKLSLKRKDDYNQLSEHYKEYKLFQIDEEAIEKFKGLDQVRICKDFLQTFFMRHAVLDSDLMTSQSRLIEIISQFNQVLLVHKDAERSILGLFKDVYLDYKYEPLVRLLRSKYFYFYDIPVFKDNQKGANDKVEFASLSDDEM